MAGRHWQRCPRGAALLIFMVLLVMGSLTWFVAHLSPRDLEAARARQTSEALVLARTALLGYALVFRDAQAALNPPKRDRMYGYLPWPDLGSSRNQNLDPLCLSDAGVALEGCDANYFSGLAFDSRGIGPTVVGRFPWRTLGVPPLRDGHGECLWLMVSSLHARILRATPPPEFPLPPMNWDTLGQLDIVVANGTNALNSILTSAHDRPVAVIFSPGPPLPGQDRRPSASDDVSQCGGNYNAANYLDPATASALGGVSNSLSGANSASGSTGDSEPANDPDAPKALLLAGKLFSTGSTYRAGGCDGANCDLLANDSGLVLTPADLFGAIRKSANFRMDIDSLLDRIAQCTGDEIAAGGTLVSGKISGADDHPCYGAAVHPLGYYPHWREMIFLARNATVNGQTCADAVLFAGQRAIGQRRITPADKADPANYLEAINTSPESQDIMRCLPTDGSLNEGGRSPALDALGGQLVDYNPASRTLTLGRLFSITAAQRTANANAFFGCSWTPEARTVGNGLRSYFKFRIRDTGEGFAFAIVDGERNAANVCGAARQHLGYSGSNGVTPAITYPKIGIELDTSRQSAIGDPGYAGGHAGIVYWGSEATTDDDNTHGAPALLPVSRPPPRNPVAPTLPTKGAGIYKLDPRLKSIPEDRFIHVRVELSRSASDETNRSTVWRLEIWLLPEEVIDQESESDRPMIAAMKNTTRPMAQLYPGFPAHLSDTPTIYDLQGGACTADTDCGSGQNCSSADNRCYAPALRSARLGFTTSQSTAARDQIIDITDFFTTWIP